MTKTEKLLRLRNLAAQARRYEYVPKNTTVEIGLRVHPVYLWYLPESGTYHPDDDDLVDYLTLKEAAGHEQIQEGSIVHLYVYTVADAMGPELAGICTGWLGTIAAPPAILDVDGRYVNQLTYANPWSAVNARR